MNQTERIYKIDQLLNDHGVVSFAVLQRTLEVSRATLKRDIEYMRSRLNAPIEWSRTLGGYRFARPASAKVGPAYALPGLWFNDQEIHALLTMQHLLATMDAGGVLGDQIAPLTTRLNALLGVTHDAADDIRRRVLVVGMARRPLPVGIFQLLGHAVLQARRVRLTYLARSTGDLTERDVSPQRLVHYRENWYLDGWCHLRNELRNFSLDMVQRVIPLAEPAKKISQQRLDFALGPGYGIFAQGSVQRAKLRFSPHRARWVAHESWHPDQQGRFDPEGRYLLEVPYVDWRELVMDILRFGADCEVLSPLSLRREMGRQVAALLKVYPPPQ